MNVLVSWSTGKDSAWMLHLLRRQQVHVGGLLTTINADAQRVAMHAVRVELLRAQAAAARLPLTIVPIPSPCPNDIYEREMAKAVRAAVAEGFTHVAFADLFLADIRRYREEKLAGSGLAPLFPLFGADTAALAREMIEGGLRARITCLDPRAIDRAFAGREFDRSLLADLPSGVDPCGERGEFHTFAYAGPMFAESIRVETGTTVERDGFVFTDVVPAAGISTETQPSGTSHLARHTPHPAPSTYPSRIVCLTEETTETLYLLGQGHRVVGVSGYTVRPPEAREKPKVSAFINARFDKIEALRPDLVLAFSDLQADLAAELVRRGLPVMVFNQRSVAEILQTIRIVGGLVGCQSEADSLAARLESDLERIRLSAASLPRRRTFFEEWDDPLISGIRWVEELVEIAGGAPIFPELRDARLGKDRIVDPAEVARRDPEVIIASWCGKRISKPRIESRPGWDAVGAVRKGWIFEVKSTYILQPGPASLTDGVRQLHEIFTTIDGGAARNARKSG